MLGRAVFLDRDGVINSYVYHPELGTVDSPANAAEFSLLPGVGRAIVRLNQLGLLVFVVSNQPGIAKGKFTVSQLHAMTNKMIRLIRTEGGRVDAVYYCRHHPDAVLPLYRKDCDCRKPKPGMILSAARDWNIDVKGSYVVGDGIGDLLAGQSVGSTTLFISGRRCYVCDELARNNVAPNFVVRDLGEAADVVGCLEGGERNSAGRFALRCMVTSK